MLTMATSGLLMEKKKDSSPSSWHTVSKPLRHIGGKPFHVQPSALNPHGDAIS
jgi:hypothetical protein